MNRAIFNAQLAALLKAFVYSEKKVEPETEDVYWEMLKDIPEDKFLAGVRKCLAQCKFFPTIAELGEASLPVRQKTIRERHRFVTFEQHWADQVLEIKRAEIDIQKLIESPKPRERAGNGASAPQGHQVTALKPEERDFFASLAGVKH